MMPYGFPVQSVWGGTMSSPCGCNSPSFTSSFGAFHCPACGYSGPAWHSGVSPTFSYPGSYPGFGAFYPGYNAWAGNRGLGGLRRSGGTYSPQYTATGLPTDEEITEMVYDTFDDDPLIPYDTDINVDVDAGVVTLSGTVLNKTMKHAAGDDAWWVPGVTDLVNNLRVVGRHRAKTPSRMTTAGTMATGTTSEGTSGARTTKRTK